MNKGILVLIIIIGITVFSFVFSSKSEAAVLSNAGANLRLLDTAERVKANLQPRVITPAVRPVAPGLISRPTRINSIKSPVKAATPALINRQPLKLNQPVRNLTGAGVGTKPALSNINRGTINRPENMLRNNPNNLDLKLKYMK